VLFLTPAVLQSSVELRINCCAFLVSDVIFLLSQFRLICYLILYFFLTFFFAQTAFNAFSLVLQAAEAATLEATSRNSKGGPV